MSVSLQLRHAQQQKAAVKLHLRLRWQTLNKRQEFDGWCEPGVHGFGLGASPIFLRFQLDRALYQVLLLLGVHQVRWTVCCWGALLGLSDRLSPAPGG